MPNNIKNQLLRNWFENFAQLPLSRLSIQYTFHEADNHRYLA